MTVGAIGPARRADRTAVETNLAVETDLGKRRRVLDVGRVATQAKVETDEQVRADERDELADAVDSFLEFIRLGVVVARLQRLGAKRAEQQRQEQVEHDQVADDHRQEEERDADERRAVETVPHGLDPLSAQHAEDDHERVQEVGEVPSRLAREVLGGVVDSEQFLAHHGEDEDDDGEDEAEVAERTHCPADDTDKQVESRPRLGQLEHPQLKRHTTYTHAIIRRSQHSQECKDPRRQRFCDS